MKAFNHNASKPKYLDKHQKVFEVILIAFWCVIFPAISAICCSLNGQNLFSNPSLISLTGKNIWDLSSFTDSFSLQDSSFL